MSKGTSQAATSLEIPLGKRKPLYRFFEMLPAILSFSMLALPVVLALINPLYAAIFIIIYIITYLMRAVAMAGRVLQSYHTMQEAMAIDWQQRLRDLAAPEEGLKRYAQETGGTRQRWHQYEHYRNLKRLSTDNVARPLPSDVINVIIIATYNESREILEPTIKAIADNDFDSRQTIVVIAYEQRGPQSTQDTAKALAKEYGHVFKKTMAIGHPEGLPNEVVGKGGNIVYAASQFRAWAAESGIERENIIITTLDSDNRPHSTYFSYIAYEFIVNDRRHNCSYQPIALFLNNIWDVPAPMRVLATGNSFWNMISSLRPHMLRNFAAHSQSLVSLEKTKFWSTRTIVEDGHQFWRSYFAFKGDYEVIPIYVPIYQDAVLSDTYRKTLKAQFIQLRRWAYGASDIPYVATKLFTKHRTVPFRIGFAKFFRLLDGHVSWGTTPLLLALGAWAPLVFAPASSQSIVAQELPQLASLLQTIAILGLFVSIFISMKMLPPRPERYRRRRTVWMLLQWVIMPVTSLIYGTSAALNSQTRLLFGRYLDKFDVTDKTVITQAADGSVKQSSSN